MNFSYTMSTNLDCMRKIWFYVNKVQGFFGPAASAGIRVHRALEKYYYDSTAYPYELNEKEQRAFFRVAAELTKIKSTVFEVETRINRRVDDDLNIVGVIDVLCSNGEIRDYKFPGRAWNEERAQEYIDKQAWMYFWLSENYIPNWTPTKVIFMVCPMEAPAEYREWTVDYDPERCQKELRKWCNQWEIIQAAIKFDNYPATPNPMKCRFCAWKGQCEASAYKARDSQSS